MTTGRDLRELQLGLFELRDSDFLSFCREVAIEIAKVAGRVSINEVRERVVVPAHVHPSVLGAVFRDRRFKAVGYTEATHSAAHARVIRLYELA